MSKRVFEVLERLSAPEKKSIDEWAPDILQAERNVRRFIPRSPLRKSEWLSELTGGDVWLKLDGLNPTGSFKVRGALNALCNWLEKTSTKTSVSTKRGKQPAAAAAQPERRQNNLLVVAASAGNHAQGVAYAAREMGLEARIFLPKGTPLVKQTQTRRLGAQVIIAGDTLDEAFELALEFVDATPGAQFLHAFNDFQVIAGQATCLMECFSQYEEATGRSAKEIDQFLCAIGGGGLAAGSALAMRYFGAGQVIGIEQEYFDSAKASLDSKNWKAVTKNGETALADGIRVKRIGKQTFEIMRQTMNEPIELVSDDLLASAITGLCENENVIAEGAGAAGVALLLKEPARFVDKKVIVCVCGGNIDPQILGRVLYRGLGVTGRIMRVILGLGDKPGQLARALSLLAQTEANLLEVHHDRTYSKAHVGTVEVELSLETRDFHHQQILLAELEKAGFSPRKV